jgi:hypothetical protein
VSFSSAPEVPSKEEVVHEKALLETRHLYRRVSLLQSISIDEYLYYRGALQTSTSTIEAPLFQRYLYFRGTALEFSPLNAVFEAAFAGTS